MPEMYFKTTYITEHLLKPKKSKSKEIQDSR